MIQLEEGKHGDSQGGRGVAHHSQLSATRRQYANLNSGSGSTVMSDC